MYHYSEWKVYSAFIAYINKSGLYVDCKDWRARWVYNMAAQGLPAHAAILFQHGQAIPALPYSIGFPFIISTAFLMYERLLNSK